MARETPLLHGKCHFEFPFFGALPQAKKNSSNIPEKQRNRKKVVFDVSKGRHRNDIYVSRNSF